MMRNVLCRVAAGLAAVVLAAGLAVQAAASASEHDQELTPCTFVARWTVSGGSTKAWVSVLTSGDSGDDWRVGVGVPYGADWSGPMSWGRWELKSDNADCDSDTPPDPKNSSPSLTNQGWVFQFPSAGVKRFASTHVGWTGSGGSLFEVTAVMDATPPTTATHCSWLAHFTIDGADVTETIMAASEDTVGAVFVSDRGEYKTGAWGRWENTTDGCLSDTPAGPSDTSPSKTVQHNDFGWLFKFGSLSWKLVAGSTDQFGYLLHELRVDMEATNTATTTTVPEAVTTTTVPDSVGGEPPPPPMPTTAPAQKVPFDERLDRAVTDPHVDLFAPPRTRGPAGWWSLPWRFGGTITDIP